MWFIGRGSEFGRWFKSRGNFSKLALSIGLVKPVFVSPAEQAQAAPAGSPTSPPQHSVAWPLAACHVLVAEDHALSRQVAGVLLQSMGHRVSFAVNGAEALASVAGGGIDLVLMDIHMPVMDGLTSAQHIRALPGPQAQVPMVALTSDFRDDLVHRAWQAGMSVVLSKPLQKCQLEAFLSTMAEGLKPLSAPL